MKKRLLYRFLILLIFLLPILSGIFRQLVFSIILLIGTLLLLTYFKECEFKLSLKNNKIIGKIVLISLLLLCYSIINSLINPFTFDGVERLIQLYMCLATLIIFSTYDWNIRDYNFVLFIIKVSVFFCLISLLISGVVSNKFSGIFSSSNTLGGVLLCYLGLYLLMPRKYTLIDKITVLSIFLLMLFSNSRSILVATFFFLLFMYLFHKNIIKNRKLILYIFIVLFTLFPLFYVNLYNSDLRRLLNELSNKYFDKNFFSGRQIMWEYLLILIKQKLLFGYGLSASPENIIGIKLSAHNWYIQMLLQVGIVGYLLLVNIFHSIWDVAQKNKKNFAGYNSCAFIIGILIWQGFEVALTQNNIQIGLFVWFVLGSGINQKLISIYSDK